MALGVVEQVLVQYGYGAIGVTLMLESMGAPLPGESMMIAAALYAATTHRLSIGWIIPVAAAGAIAGDQIGYLIGRWAGMPLLHRWGRRIGLTDERLQLGQYLFRRHGGKVVFLGRFVVVLRTFAALLAGANGMAWPRFLLWNALGGVAWTCLYGLGAYVLGDALRRITGPIGIVLGVLGAAALIAAIVVLKRNERRLTVEATAAMHEEAGRPDGASGDAALLRAASPGSAHGPGGGLSEAGAGTAPRAP